MKGWRFALTRRWAGYLALAVAFAVVCVGLGAWQFDRRAQARAEISRIESNYDRAPVPVSEALGKFDSFEESQKWLPVSLTGTYLSEHEVLVRNRPFAGRPGFEILTPMRLTDDTVFIVDRGWLPTGSKQDAPDVVPAAPTGEVTVTARLREGEPLLPGRTSVEGSGQIATAHLPQLAEMVGEPTYTGAYGLIATPGANPGSVPTESLRPTLDEGPHLSYALQWYVFAIIGFFGLGWALRQEYRAVNSDEPEERDRAEERARRKAAKAPTDSESEDAIIEALERR